MGEGFVIRIGKRGFPKGRGGKAGGSGAEGIEEAVHDRYWTAETRAFAFEHFVIFRENRVAEDQFEFLLYQPREDFMGSSVSRTEGREENVGVEDGPDHGEGFGESIQRRS